MNKAEAYEKRITEFAEELKRSDKPVVIFGASRGGWYIMKVLEHFKVGMTAFIDNNPEKHGEYLGKPASSPQKICQEISDARVILGVLNYKNSEPVETQLQSVGFEKIYNMMDVFLFAYFTLVAGRKCDHSKLAESISLLYNDGVGRELFLSPTLSYMTTQKCTLKCKECGAFVPHYKSPETFDVEIIVRDIENYCKAFDVVHHIALQGGEPFLHKELKRLCIDVARIPNLIFVDFVTNGTIMPSMEEIQQFADCGNCVLISDYGPFSTKMDRLSKALLENDVYFDYYRYDLNAWLPMTPIYQRNRGLDRNTEIFKKCIANPRMCCQIMNGRLYRCSFSNNGTGSGLLPEFENDFVRLDDKNISEKELITKIRSLAGRAAPLEACDYCPADEHGLVPAGVQ